MNKKLYEYILYGYKIVSNYKLEILNEYNGNSFIDVINLKINLNKSNNFNNYFFNVYYTEKNNIIYLSLNENINYEVDYIRNIIIVNCNNIEFLNSTLLNLPFSLFFAYREDELLLHASGVINNMGNLIAISGEKGSGKSTTTSALLKCNNKFFSDDTMLIKLFKNEIFCFQGSKILKLNIDAFKTNYKNENFNLYKKIFKERLL